MDRPLLNEPNVYPGDAVLKEVLGPAIKTWNTMQKLLSEKFPSVTLGWKYYHDGKAWLCKAQHKKKTVCWISVWDRFFKTTFYFTEKNGPEIARLDIGAALKKRFREYRGKGKLKALTIEMKAIKDLKHFGRIADYKIGCL